MKICELFIRNFGKFQQKKMTFTDGIQILYGENESGKSTIHTCIRAMLFGMERGRGRAALTDTFSTYEPWENPNYYSGALKFEAGGKTFLIDRNFDKYTKKASAVCLDDGEELSVEAGDLEAVLGGLTASGFDDTVSIAQLKARPGETLAAELKNYATNYYVTGDSELDLEGALGKLDQRQKEAEKGIHEVLSKKQAEREHLEQEASYIWREMHQIREEQEQLSSEIAIRLEQEKKRAEVAEAEKGVLDEMRAEKWRIHPVELIVFAVLIVSSFLLVPKPWNSYTTIVIFLCCLIYVWNRMKIGKKDIKTEPERILEEITQQEEKPLERLLWEQEHNADELRDKQVQYNNLQERLGELDETGEEHMELERRKKAAMQAAEKIRELSGSLQDKMKKDLNFRASQIMGEITGGKYTRLIVGADLSLCLFSEGRKIPVTQVSRGTVEQIYFALRMAAGELLHDEEYPVILDDAFVYYDEKRLSQVLEWLYQNKKQVIILTCQNREEEMLKKMNIPYKKESLS